MTDRPRSQMRLRFAFIGIAAGAVFPAVSAVLVFGFGLPSTYLLVIIGLAVPVLGTVGGLIGSREDRLTALASDLEHQIAERTAAIRNMLDVTGDGFLTFGPDYRVHPEYSRACEEIFGGPIAGKRLPDLLYMEEHPRGEFIDGLDLYFTGKAKPGVIFDLLDKRVEIGDRIIQIDYRAIDETTVMCALTDVTEQERLEAEVEEQERRRTLILRAVSNREHFAGFLDEANDLFQVLDEISSHRSSQIPDETTEKLAAQIHTFKGNASFLGFVRTATVAHDFEDQLAALPVLQNDLDLSSEVFVLKRQYYQEYNSIAETLGERWINDLSTINVPRNARQRDGATAQRPARRPVLALPADDPGHRRAARSACSPRGNPRRRVQGAPRPLRAAGKRAHARSPEHGRSRDREPRRARAQGQADGG
ncbi:MAG: Hpt domain-containing protein [Spirochaetota bacterium]